MRVRDLAQHLNLTELAQRPAMVHVDEWRDAKIIKADVENCRVLLFDSEQEEIVPSNQVYPSLPTWRISQLLAHRGRSPTPTDPALARPRLHPHHRTLPRHPLIAH